MTSSILRYPASAAVMRLTAMSRAVEYGFIAAGLTVSLIAAIQSLRIILTWTASL